MNRDAMRRFGEAAKAAGVEGTEEWDPDQPMDDGNPLGEPESAISWRVDVSPWLERRRASLEAHRSQTTDVGHDARDAARGVRGLLRPRALHRAGPPAGHGRGVAVRRLSGEQRLRVGLRHGLERRLGLGGVPLVAHLPEVA